MTAETMFRTGFALLLLTGLCAGCLSVEMTDHSGPGSVSVAPTERLNATEPFELTGQVFFELDETTTERSRFEDVRLCLYAENGTVLAAEPLGAFEAPSTVVNVSVRTEQAPWYIYVHHPAFQSLEEFDNELLVYRPDDDRYGPGTVEDLPVRVERLTETRCRPA